MDNAACTHFFIPTHFENECIRMISKRMKIPHRFNLPYTPWSNGGVERLGKELVRVSWDMTSEVRWDFSE